MAVLPFGKWLPDVSDVNSAHTQEILNVVPQGDGYGPVFADVALTNALPGTARGAFLARKEDGSVAIFAGTTTKLYLLDNTDFTWADVSNAAGTYTPLSLNANWEFVQFGSLVIATQANAVMQVFDVQSDTEFADLAGSPPQAAHIAIVNQFIVASGLAGTPRRIQWCGISDVTEWTAGVAYSDYQDMSDGGNITGVIGGEFGVIVQDGAIRRMIFSPGSDIVFQIDRIAKGVGCTLPLAIVEADGFVYFPSAKGFIRISPDGGITPIGLERVDRTFAAQMDSATPYLTQGCVDPTTGLIYWTYKGVDRSDAGFSHALIYSPTLDRWSKIEVDGETLFTSAQPGLTLEGVAAIYPDLDAMEPSLDSFSAGTLNKLSMFDTSHKLGHFTGAARQAILTTSEQTGLRQRVFVTSTVPLTDATTGYVSIGARETLQSAPVYGEESQINEWGETNHLANTKYARAKLRIPAGTVWTYATGIDPKFRAGGR